MPIPLLRLPLLASIPILKDLSIIDLTNLLQLSKRTQQLVKFTKTHIKLEVSRDSFQFEMIDDPVKVVNVSFNSRNVSAPNERMLPFKPVLNQTSRTRREHAIEEYKRMMDNFVDIFIVDLVSFKLKNATFQSAFCFIEYARRIGLKFGHAEIEILRDKNEDYQKLLAVCSDASELSVDVNSRRNFMFDGFNQFKMDYFLIRCFGVGSLNWFTVDNMCDLVNCSRLGISLLNWGNEDFNEFLKFWVASDGRLNWFSFSNAHYINSRVVLDGIHNIERELNEVREVFEIERSNGIRAKVTYERLGFRLTVIHI
ncbi:unnamed protein product [Caenorhabditis brenneri]